MSSLISTLKGIFSGDTLFLFLTLVFFFGYAMFLGRGRIISLTLSFWPAAFLYNSFPFVNKLLVLHGDKLITFNKVAIFLIFLFPISIILNRFVIGESFHTGAAHLWRTVAFALCAVILVLILSYSLIDLNAFHDFSPQIDALFTGLDKVFYWNIAVLAILAFL